MADHSMVITAELQTVNHADGTPSMYVTVPIVGCTCGDLRVLVPAGAVDAYLATAIHQTHLTDVGHGDAVVTGAEEFLRSVAAHPSQDPPAGPT